MHSLNLSTRNFVMKKSIIGAAAALLAYSFTPAHADTWPEQKSVEVLVGDLDLTKAAGIHTLFIRVRGAAREACNSIDSSGSLTYGMMYRACVHEAIDNAVATVNNPRFTDYVAERRAPLVTRIASN
jgi:UrcA family protein